MNDFPINSKIIKEAIFTAKDVLETMGSTSRHGTVSYFDLDPANNTISKDLHNTVRYELARLKSDLKLEKNNTLIDENGIPFIIKTTSDGRIKANHVGKNTGWYIVIKYNPQKDSNEIKILQILIGYLQKSDWKKQGDKTNFAVLTKRGESKLKTIYQDN